MGQKVGSERAETHGFLPVDFSPPGAAGANACRSPFFRQLNFRQLN